MESTLPRARVLVAMERIELVGFLATAPAGDDDLDPATTAEVTSLLVVPRWGRRGHGARLLAAAVDGWRSDGTATAVCWAWERDPATRTFLESAGWAADGARRGLDTGAGVEGQLRFHVDVREEG